MNAYSLKETALPYRFQRLLYNLYFMCPSLYTGIVITLQDQSGSYSRDSELQHKPL